MRRRMLLAALATGGVAAAVSGSDGEIHGGTSLGGNEDASLADPFAYGGWSFSPETLPPEAPETAWVSRSGRAELVAETGTWTASGIRWSLAGTMADARAALDSTPAVAATTEGAFELRYEGSPPITWRADGVVHVIDVDLASARQRADEAPAVLWAADGAAEVVLND